MSDGGPALFRRFPALEAEIPWVALGRYPTPVETVRIEDRAGRPRTILVKRDDQTAELYGGNKVRKLEFLLAEAVRRDAHRIITAGAAGSHHGLATTVYGRKLGFQVSLVLFPQRLTPHVRDVVLMDAGFGAELRWVGRMELVPLGMLRARRAHRADQPFVIAPGGSDPVGTIGYVNAALELAEQIENDRIARPSRVHVAAGTLGTAAGLAVGFAMAGLDLPITATRISRRIVTNLPALRGLVRGASELLRKAGASVPSENRALRLVRIAHRQFGRGYGEETEAGREAVRIFAALGLRLDPTYTAKAAAELMMSSDEDDAPPLFLLTLSAAEPMDRARAIRPADLPAKFAEYLAQPPAQTSD